jgi:hypothetical protein
MANEVTTTKPAPFGTVSLKNAAGMATAMAQSATVGQLGAAPDGSDYLNFSGKLGVYQFGKDKSDISEDEVWLVNIESLMQGWSCWKGGQPAATRLASIFGVPVATPDFEEFGPFKREAGEGWFVTKAFVMRSLDEDDRQAFFKSNSKTGVAAISDLQELVAPRLAVNGAFWPIVQMGREKFLAQGQWNSKPVISVYGWLTTDNMIYLCQNPEADLDELIALSAKGDTPDDFEESTEVEEVEVEEVPAPPAAPVSNRARRQAQETKPAEQPKTEGPRRRRAGL